MLIVSERPADQTRLSENLRAAKNTFIIYLHCVPNIYLDKNNEFVVKEWKILNLIVGLLLLVFLIFIIYVMGIEENISPIWISFIGAPFFILVLIYQKNARNSSIIIRVNETGIYYYGDLITKWQDFHTAYVTDEEYEYGDKVSDNFKLVLEFYRNDLLIRRKLKLTNTQNRSEEEIYAAIMYFHRQHMNANGETIDADAEPLKQLSQ